MNSNGINAAIHKRSHRLNEKINLNEFYVKNLSNENYKYLN